MIRGQIYAESKWEKIKVGKFSASAIQTLFVQNKEKTGMGKVAEDYVFEKAAELITGTIRQFSNDSTDWGNQYEVDAAERVQQHYPKMEYFGKVSPEFFQWDELSGGSPDMGSVPDKLITEIKCPENPTNHVRYIMKINCGKDLKKEDADYYAQTEFNMMCFAKKHNIPFTQMKGLFVSFCPLVRDPFKDFHMVVIEPDLEFYEKITRFLPVAQQMLADIIDKLIKPL